MNPMKHVGLAMSVLALSGLFASSPALAGKPPKPVSYTYRLTPPETNPPEPQATGRWTLTEIPSLPLLGATVAVRCRSLTPGKQYLVLALVHWIDPDWGYDGWYSTGGTFTADGKGTLSADFDTNPWLLHIHVHVDDLWVETEGNVVLETAW